MGRVGTAGQNWIDCDHVFWVSVFQPLGGQSSNCVHASGKGVQLGVDYQAEKYR